MSHTRPFPPRVFTPAVIMAVVLTSCVNLLALIGPIFMIEVYDRVIPSKNMPTLVALGVLAAFLYLFSGVLDVVRGRIMARVAGVLDIDLASSVFRIIATMPRVAGVRPGATRPAADLDQIRQFLSGSGLLSLFDLPWALLYLFVCFLFHPYIGVAATSALLVLVMLTAITHFATKREARNLSATLAARGRLEEEVHRNVEAIASMGLFDRAYERWFDHHEAHAKSGRKINDLAGMAASASKTFRYAVQSGVLALGAFLVVDGQLTGGMILASSVIVSRALAPVEQVIGQWKCLIGAMQAWRRLSESSKLATVTEHKTNLAAPQLNLQVRNVAIVPPGTQKLAVKNASFALEAGSILGVIGPSGSGKSCLVRAIAGIWSPLRGEIRLDGAALDQWTDAARGSHIGYLPQTVELFEGTVAENISRFDKNANDDDILDAAHAAGAHDMIVHFEHGYETAVGEGGKNLSAGQRQRIALARALFKKPFLVVLDEPNSNLDVDGERALANALQRVKDRNGIVVVVAHRSDIMNIVDHVLMLRNGDVAMYGKRDAIINRISEGPRALPATTLKVVDGDLGA
ncbi:type I secretion system permease/ATPase [Rhizobium sp. BK619]|uniref:type I secretion system permease/ATPase n=1 Tax=Rhizobium sp. BK619 TaxID=2586989 RepID=UPI00161ACA11|nr:type I secretion system permease/ATPase [Rhizobium sp. BK619]